MILRSGILSCVRTKFYNYRSISISSIRLNDESRQNLPSRKLFEELTEKVYMKEQLSRSGRRAFEVMVEKPIVVKSFFVANIEDEDITYPEVMSKADLDNCKKANVQISEYFTKQIEYNETGFSPSVYKAFNDMHLFGYNVPKAFGGQELSYTQRTLASEALNQNIAAAQTLNAHRSVCAAITEIGTDEQCAKYLPKLANGELIATTAFHEWNPADKVGLNTQAEYDDGDEHWYLNGTKSFVINAADSNLFLVLAQTRINDHKGDKKDSLSVFMVDRHLPGVTVHKKNKTIGHTNLYMGSVTFNDVKLSKDSVLSIPGTGEYIKQKIQIHSRLDQGSLNLTQMKSILKYMMSIAESIESATATESQQNEAKTLRLALGKYACSIYALESMLYLTTGIMDKYENTNIDLETAIFKTYSQDQLVNMTMELLNFVDSRVTVKEHPVNQFIENAVQLKFDEPKNKLKIHIGSVCIQHRMNRIIQEVHVKKNKEFLMQNFMEQKQFEGYEPQLRAVAERIFHSIRECRLGSSSFIEMESQEMSKRHIEFQKMADVAACIYAQFACLLRCDRSLKMKLPSAQYEVAMCKMICDKNDAEIQKQLQYIDAGPVKTFAKYHDYVTFLLLQKQYDFPAHPLTRFF